MLKECISSNSRPSVSEMMRGIRSDLPCGKRFRTSQPDQIHCPKCGGRTEIRIEADQSVRAVWTGPKGRGSLRQHGAENCADYANKLDHFEIAAVVRAVKACPFPLGSGAAVYREMLASVLDAPEAYKAEVRAMSLGELRKAVTAQGADGFNAPTDSYLRIAVAVKHGETDRY
jgi:hypothetical protein